MRERIPLPLGDSKRTMVQAMFDRVAHRYELINRFITFGLDRRWRKSALAYTQLAKPSLVLDIACGTGDFCRLLDARGHSAIGIDFSLGMLRNAHTDSQLVQADALALPILDSSVEAIVCGFGLRNFSSLPQFLDESARVIKPGGRICLLEAACPTNPIIKFGHSIYFGKIVPLIGGALSDAAAYKYLPRSLAYLPTPSEMASTVRSAGFTDVSYHRLLWGCASVTVATRTS